MKYLRPRLPEKEIELCLDLFDKQEAKKRILKYIEGVFDDAESQLKSEQLESGITCMMCRKPKENDGHTCCEECAGLAF